MVVSASKDDPFEYDALPTPTSIRLVSLLKRNDSEDAQFDGRRVIKVRLNAVDLVDRPIFKALSYTWGNPFGTQNQPPDTYGEKDLLPLDVDGKLVLIRRNLYEALEQFLDPSTAHYHNIDKRILPYQKTKLIQAAEEGNSNLVAHCLERGADVAATDRFGESALHYAAENGYLETVKILLASGASTVLLDQARRTPLACCRQRKRGQYEEVARLLATDRSCNTEAALMHRSTSKHILHEDDLWIDSICINQDDIAERNAQVALMAKIYTSAVSVVAWLGPADDGIKLVGDTFPGYRDASLQDAQATSPRKDASEALRALASRAWFRRKWIIQELCLAQALEVHCGRFQPHIDSLNWPRDMVLRYSAGAATETVYRLLALRRWYCRAVGRKNAPSLPGPPPLPCLSLLIILTWGALSSDPRDRIFALLGLVAEAPSTKRDGSSTVIANYSKSMADVFVEAGRLLVEEREVSWENGLGEQEIVLEPLAGLSYVQHLPYYHEETDSDGMVIMDPEKPGTDDELPSWVPKFHQKLRTERIYRRDFAASGKGAEHEAQTPGNRSSLILNGLLFDTVSEVEVKASHHQPYFSSISREVGVETARSRGMYRCFWRLGHRGAWCYGPTNMVAGSLSSGECGE